MFRIRQEQLHLLANTLDHQFALELRRDLREHCAAQVQHTPDDILLQRIETGIRRAHRYGFRKKRSIGMFVELLFLVGPRFDEYPGVIRVLLDQRLSPDDRMDRLLSVMTESMWQSARLRSQRKMRLAK